LSGTFTLTTMGPWCALFGVLAEADIAALMLVGLDVEPDSLSVV
jgi:hypothetical protein